MLSTFLQTAVDAVEAVPVQEELSFSLISMAAKGGWLMLVLLALSIIAIYIFGKKWWMIRQANKIGQNFMNDIRDYIHECKIKSAITLCEKYDSPIARLVEKGIDANRMTYEGHGFSQPVGDNETWLGRHQNRRIEITFKYD